MGLWRALLTSNFIIFVNKNMFRLIFTFYPHEFLLRVVAKVCDEFFNHFKQFHAFKQLSHRRLVDWVYKLTFAKFLKDITTACSIDVGHCRPYQASNF